MSKRIKSRKRRARLGLYNPACYRDDFERTFRLENCQQCGGGRRIIRKRVGHV
jgi:hypothetical protein